MPGYGNQDRNGTRRDNGERNRDDEMRSRYASQYGGHRADQMDDERGIGRDDRERYARDRHERDRDDERWRPDDRMYMDEQRNRGRDDWREPPMERERFGRERNELDYGDRNMGGRDDWRQAQRGSFQPSRDYRGETSRDREGNGDRNMSGRDMYWNNMDRDRDRDRQQQRQAGFRGKGPIGYQRSDERIKEDVCEALTDDDAVDASSIDINVKQGEVTLTGTVPDRSMKRMAEECIERIPGIKDVQNQLRVQASGDDTSRGKGARDADTGASTKTATTEKIKH
jgi:hypothetical protein